MTHLYMTPPEFCLPLHHVRPRFKDDLEGVLMFFVDSVARIGKCEKQTFDRSLDTCLHEYPGNATKSRKTMSNWRTEISALFSLVWHEGDYEAPSRRCFELAERRNLPEAFRWFLYKFQYPGGHLRPDYAAELILSGVRFKPVQTILKVFKAGNPDGGNSFCLSRGEVCHCIFNDLRVTRDGEDASATLARIMDNRRNGRTYVEDGDVVRYAGDILDYMQIAGLLKTHNGRDFHLNPASNSAILKFISNDERFMGYDSLYGRNAVTAGDVASRQSAWEDYANQELPDDDLSIDLSALLGDGLPVPADAILRPSPSRGEGHAAPPTTEDVGERGEALVYGHECMRLKKDGREDLVHLVKRIPTSLALGFDISSVESDTEQKRYIEVKSTASFRPIVFNTIHLTPNEWRVAETERRRYFVYRLFICFSTGDARLYTLRDPVGEYKSDRVTMMPSSSGGVDVRFDSGKVGKFEELLKWNA